MKKSGIVIKIKNQDQYLDFGYNYQGVPSYFLTEDIFSTINFSTVKEAERWLDDIINDTPYYLKDLEFYSFNFTAEISKV